jgi:peptidoglycan/xylan/chitin deacetylase (PgdA/CDA1 family)
MGRQLSRSSEAVHTLLPSGGGRVRWLLLIATVLALFAPVTSLVNAPAIAAESACPNPTAGAVYRTPATYPKTVALTFDDGPSGGWTPQVLDILKANGIKATFFVIGENVRQNPALVRRTLAAGHQIGNHTDTHPNMPSLSATAQAQQMDAAATSIAAAGGSRVCFFRAPGGEFNPTTLQLARERGMSLIGWSNDTLDWAAPLSISTSYQAGIVDRAINPVYDHPIVLMHDGSPGNYRQNTVDSVQRVIDSYRSRGYVFTDPLGRIDTDFVCDSGTGAAYRIVGGAPVYVSTWAAFGGPQPCRVMSSAEIAALPRYPADGTFVRGTSTGAVYRIAGGAPVYVSTWVAFGGVQPFVDVDQAAIDRAGSGGFFGHLLFFPADGTFVRGTSTGAVYRIAGGAPVYVSTWVAFGGCL